jgi:pyruvate/oxaloacetate carboxyltransferase
MTRPVKFNNTIRDSYQSNLSAAPSATEIVTAEPHAAQAGWASVQVGGGTFFDVPVLRGRDPWVEQKILCDAYPEIPKTILVRGDSAVGYNIYASDVVRAMIAAYAKTGVNGFTIFDGLNDTRNQRAAIAAVHEAAAKGHDVYAQGGICVGNSTSFTLDHALRSADALVKMGVRDLYLKDPVGVADPEFVYKLVKRLKTEFENNVYMHTHNTHGMAYALYMAAIEAGVDAVDVAHPAAGENVAQPSALRILHMMQKHPNEEVRLRAPLLDMRAIAMDVPTITALRFKYASLEPAFDRDVLDAMLAAKAPGGAASTLKGIMEAQFAARGKNWREAQIAIYKKQAEILPILGDPLQVTPHAKNTTAFAAARLLMGEKALTQEIAQYLTGQYGDVPGTPDPDLVKQALVKSNMTDVFTGTPSDLVKTGMLNARDALGAAGIENSADEDVVTVALLNKGDQGLKHVIAKQKGQLSEMAPPQLPRYARTDRPQSKAHIRDGITIKGVCDVFDALGGGVALLQVALNALDIEKTTHYKRPALSDAEAIAMARAGPHALNNLFHQWCAASADAVDLYVRVVPTLLRKAGFADGAQMVGALHVANTMIRDVCTQKGVSEKFIPKITPFPKNEITDDSRKKLSSLAPQLVIMFQPE